MQSNRCKIKTNFTVHFVYIFFLIGPDVQFVGKEVQEMLLKSADQVYLPKIVTRMKCSKSFDSERAMHAFLNGFLSVKQ